jgi:hypothetical protein
MTGTTATIAPSNHSDALTREQLDSVVARLSDLMRAEKMSCAQKVGEFIVREIYRGDLEALRARGRKDASFRRLARHPQLPCSATTLWRQVSIFELAQRFPGILTTKHFGVSHARAVLGLDPTAQEKLIRACLQQRWSADELEARAQAHRGPPCKHRDAERCQSLRTTLRRVDRLTSELLNVELLPTTPPELRDAEHARDTIRRLRAWCDAVERRYGTPVN